MSLGIKQKAILKIVMEKGYVSFEDVQDVYNLYRRDLVIAKIKELERIGLIQKEMKGYTYVWGIGPNCVNKYSLVMTDKTANTFTLLLSKAEAERLIELVQYGLFNFKSVPQSLKKKMSNLKVLLSNKDMINPDEVKDD